MKKEKLTELYHKYKLEKDDFFKHQHYTIITRQGIDKIQSIEQIKITYNVIKCEPNFAVFKAIAIKDNNQIETFGSALKGSSYSEGNCQSWYIAEMAEKRAMSRAVLKLTGFYELGVFGEDESDSFKNKTTKQEIINKIKNK
jgi:hypothetical protein|tara:strand:+ start:1633 stop:2058 length:426 start_codon:yes stop_codon:yes gene_type:complete